MAGEPRPRGRPARPDLRLVGLSIRIQAKVADEICRRARAARMNVAEYMREVVVPYGLKD